MQKNLTERFLQTLKPPTMGRTEFYDQTVKGLSVRVTVSGIVTFALFYRLPGDRQKRRMTLGQYPALGLAEARRKARATLLDAARESV